MASNLDGYESGHVRDATRTTANKVKKLTGKRTSDRDAEIVGDLYAATQGGMHTDDGNRQRLERLPYRDLRIAWAFMDSDNLTPKQWTALAMYYLPDWRRLPRPTEAECAEVLGISAEAFGDRLDAAERRACGPPTRRRRPPKGRGNDGAGAIEEILARLWTRTYGDEFDPNEIPPEIRERVAKASPEPEAWEVIDWRGEMEFDALDRMVRERPGD